MPEVREKNVYGYILKKEELKWVEFAVKTDVLCLVASNPFPGYPNKVDKNYYYLVLDPKTRIDNDEELLRITRDINQTYHCSIDATPCELTLYNRIHPGLRIFNPDESLLPMISGYYRRYGVSFLKIKEVQPFVSLIKVHKYFDLEEKTEGICKSRTSPGFYYVKIPAKLEWEEFNRLMTVARNEAGFNGCDFAMAVFRTNNSIEDYVRIFTDDCTVEKQLAFRDFIIESVKSLTLK